MSDKQLPIIERNFHIMNDDRFIMEKMSLPVEIQDGEDIHAAINRTRETIVQNFKAAYPKVEYRMNFDEVIQVKKGLYDIDLSDKKTSEYLNIQSKPNKDFLNDAIEEKIKSGTIEEQIQACESLVELETFKVIASMNPKLNEVYEKKLSEFKQGKQKKSNSINQ